jgi:hypothetical protein
VPTTYCSVNELVCGGSVCGPGTGCCDTSCAASCPDRQTCCADTDCPANQWCNGRWNQTPGKCEPITATSPTCNPSLSCGGMSCGAGSCCVSSPNACSPGCAQATDRYCCAGSDCPPGYDCTHQNGDTSPGTCQPTAPPPPSCDVGNNVVCGGSTCIGTVCCNDGSNACVAACAWPTSQYCCENGVRGSCPTGYQCNRPTAEPGTCELAPVDAGADAADAGMDAADAADSADAGATYPYCDGTNILHCTATPECNTSIDSCCSDGVGGTVCNPGPDACGGNTRYCCTDTDCAHDGGPGTCVMMMMLAVPLAPAAPNPTPMIGTCGP